MKKFILLCGLIFATMNTSAQPWEIGWPNAADVTATLNDGTLTISGTGSITSWNNANNVPWYSVRASITTVIINDGITSIGNRAFDGCTDLSSVTIPNSVTTIGSSVFAGCTGLTSITIPDSVIRIGNGAFLNCTGLTSVTIGNSVTSIGEVAFRGCTGLTSVTIGNSVISIGNEAFRGCTGLTSVTIPNSVTSIGWYAFYNCTGLTSVNIPNSVTSIENSAFENCTGLTSVTIGNRVTSIGSWAFFGCTGLTSVTIGNSVTSIGSAAFRGCTGLQMVIVPWTTPLDVSANIFQNVNTNQILLVVPQGRESVYKAHDVWGQFRVFASVIHITEVATTATVGTPLTLTATVTPSDATYQTIVWSIADAGTTGASLTENVLNTTFSGTVILRATVVNGTTIGTDYTQEFPIVVTCEHFWTDATCTTPKTCSVCSDTEGAALGHTWMDATCETPKTCSVCSETEGSALGHTWIDATCETPKTCSVCSETEGPALGHTWIDATCEMPKTCSVCSEIEGPALDHNLTTWQITDATCDADGYSTRNCLRDNCDYTERITIPKLTGADCNQTSVVETHNYASLLVYPNPVTNGQLIIDNGKLKNGIVEIFDMKGKRVYHESFSIFNSQFSINVSHLPNGIYIVKIGKHSARIVKSY